MKNNCFRRLIIVRSFCPQAAKTPESDNDNKREANETNNGQRLTEDAFWLQWLKQQGKQPDGQFYPSESGSPSAHPNENTNGYAIEKSPLAEEFIAKWQKQQGLD